MIPVKSLARAKSRLLGAADSGVGDAGAHATLVLAMVTDTVRAALHADTVRRVVVVTPDPLVALAAEREGARALCDEPAGGLNAALRYGASVLRADDPGAVIGALQADLPALRPTELSAAIAAAAGRRAFCPDRQGGGTTLLLGARGGTLRPHFGPGSAAAHLATGALLLAGPWPTVGSDVDSEDDLRDAYRLGLGEHTAGVLARARGLAPVHGWRGGAPAYDAP
ncbi:2-phospho-L-lactate guanylyltransferase [Planosporangium flavigriseum]